MSRLHVLIFLIIGLVASEGSPFSLEDEDTIQQLRTLRQIQQGNTYQDAVSFETEESYEIEPNHRISKRSKSTKDKSAKKRFRTSFDPKVIEEHFGPDNDDVPIQDSDGITLLGRIKRSVHETPSWDTKEYKKLSHQPKIYEKPRRKHHKRKGRKLKIQRRTSFAPSVTLESFGPDDTILKTPGNKNIKGIVVISPQGRSTVYKSRFHMIKPRYFIDAEDSDEDYEYDTLDIRNGLKEITDA